VIAGDQSGCISPSASVNFNGVGSGTNTTSHMTCGTGCIIDTTGSGQNKATNLQGWTWPAFSIPVTTSAVFMTSNNSSSSTVVEIQVPNCNATNSALQFQTLSNGFQCVAMASYVSGTGALQCNGTSNACPDTTSVTVNNTTYAVKTFAIAANLIPANHCLTLHVTFKHSASASSNVFWNIGGTASGSYPTQTVTGGTNLTAANLPSSGLTAINMLPLTVCNYNNSTHSQFSWVEQLQAGGNNISGTAATSSGVDTTNTFNIYFMASNSSGNNDAFTFYGGVSSLQ